MKQALALVLITSIAHGSPDGGTVLVDYADPDAGIYTVQRAELADGGTVEGPGFFFTPERVVKIAAGTIDLQNTNARLLSEKEQLQLEVTRARNGRPIFGVGFWTGVGVGAVLTVVIVGGAAAWISSKRQ